MWDRVVLIKGWGWHVKVHRHLIAPFLKARVAVKQKYCNHVHFADGVALDLVLLVVLEKRPQCLKPPKRLLDALAHATHLGIEATFRRVGRGVLIWANP